MSTSTTETSQQYHLPTYARFPLAIARGQGARLWDEDDKMYLDFCSGIATCSLGHCHPAMVETITTQARELIHCSNLFHTKPLADLAKLLVEDVMDGEGKVFFANSGAEANDGLIKLARKYGQTHSNPAGQGRHEIITFSTSFHGRTIGSMSATAQGKIHDGFGPLLPGFHYAEFNNLEAAKNAITENTVAFLVEPIQGEGGVNVATADFLHGLRELADQHDLLLLLDEIQCGLGRTGTLCGWNSIAPGLKPDALSWAKGIGGGFPIASFWVSEKKTHTGNLSQLLGPSTHGSTYGGNPLATATAHTVVQTIINESLPQNAQQIGDFIQKKITSWNHPLITGIRGKGLLLGIGIDASKFSLPQDQTPAAHLVSQNLQAGLILIPAGPDTIRLIPPLNITKADAQEALTIFKNILDQQ
nr:acetylornithine aminotransferase-like [Nerophis lumbriciformis]